MLQIVKPALKRIIPAPLVDRLRLLKLKTYDQWYKKRVVRRMQRKHALLLEDLREKERIRVVFLAIHNSVWKVDPVFRKMLDDPYFEPVILVCPYTVFGEERMWQDMRECIEFFKAKGYPVISSHDEAKRKWVDLADLAPDIVFFTNPHNLTRKEYYREAYLKYLSCYVPYSHDVSRYDNYQSQYNQEFHNVMWKIFAPHSDDQSIFETYSLTRGVNVIVTGYPACEDLIDGAAFSPWESDQKIRIIWAPHHTIDMPSLPYSNFLELAEFFMELSTEYFDKVQIAFKPHPLLKSKLYNNRNWGIKKTDEYYDFWKCSPNTLLALGDYLDLFKTSHAMIHDSGSFLAEYQYLSRPVFFICNDSIQKYLNPFGLRALACCVQGNSPDKIRKFIDGLIAGSVDSDNTFYDQSLRPYFSEDFPSDKIVRELKFIETLPSGGRRRKIYDGLKCYVTLLCR